MNQNQNKNQLIHQLIYDDLKNQSRYIIPIISAQWQNPSCIHAFSTLAYYFKQNINQPYTRKSFNLGIHTCINDEERAAVDFNRYILSKALNSNLFYFNQTHSSICHDLDHLNLNQFAIEGDASLSSMHPCLVMTADCLPIFITDDEGKYYSAIHAGWRGIANGVIKTSIQLLLEKSQKRPHQLIAHLAPAIGEHAFEVGVDVLEIFTAKHPKIYAHRLDQLFKPMQFEGGKSIISQKFLANIYELARFQLLDLGVLAQNISQNPACTFFDQRFFSYRRSEIFKKETFSLNSLNPLNILNTLNGRMAHIIYRLNSDKKT